MTTIDHISTRPGGSDIPAGKAYFETSTNKFVVWNGSSWIDLHSDGDGTGAIANQYSVDFDGTNDVISGPAVGTTVGTCSMWFYNDDVITTSSVGQVLLNSKSYNFGIVLGNQTGLSNEVIAIQYSGGRFGYTGAGLSIPSGWHHVMVAWVSNSSTNSGNAGYDIWLDGVKVGNDSQSAPSSPETLATSGNGFHIGARLGTGSVYRPFDGKIDEFAVWSTDVSSDISTIYNGGAGAVDLNALSTAPEIWWRMGDDDAGTGTTITNQGSEGSNANGTLVNGPIFSSDVPS